MKIKILLVITLIACSSCASGLKKPQRGISSTLRTGLDLAFETNMIIDMIAAKEINGDTCDRELKNLINDYKLATPENLDIELIKKNGQNILDQSFNARLALHSAIETFPSSCRLKLKELNLLMRASEDYVGVHFYQDPQVAAESIKFEDQPTPIYQISAYHPYHVTKDIDPNAKFEFKNGDILITKGVSFVSSTVSEIATPRSLFSHIVFVHVDEKTKEVTTLESYIGKGVGIYSIENALKNENARILVLRAKDYALAARAANYMYDKVMELKKKNKIIYYDYDLNFEDNTKLSCEEIAYDSFKQNSDGKFIIPEVMSNIAMEDEAFLKRIGVKKGSMMTPADMETDSRFDIVLDWTDYRIMRDSWRKDAVLGEMFRWVNEHHYKIHENLNSEGAKIVWSTRHIPGLWEMLARVSGLPKDMTKDVPSKTISTMASLKTIGGILLPIVAKADEEYFAKNGKWMSSEMLRDTLEKFRETDPKKLRKVFRERR